MHSEGGGFGALGGNSSSGSRGNDAATSAADAAAAAAAAAATKTTLMPWAEMPPDLDEPALDAAADPWGVLSRGPAQ